MTRTVARARTIFAVLFAVAIVQAPQTSLAQRAGSGLVVADTPLATKAGMEILERGGNAVDAAIATAFALSVVDQASSGLGGGGFMVIYDAREKRAHALDFRETAPEAARTELYLKDGKPVAALSLSGGLAVAVPGETAGLMAAFKRFGSLPLSVLMEPAIRYAVEGFPLDVALRYVIERQKSNMKKYPDLARVFMPKDDVPAEGAPIRQPELAETLKAITSQGSEVFYSGWIAQAIVETVKKEGGVITLEDLKNYKAVWREPLIGHYRGRTLITMPPPSSGGIALVEMLNVLQGFPVNKLRHNDATYLHLLSETMKHAFADRAQYLGDPDFVKAPLAMLASQEYAAWVRSRISPAKTQLAKYYGFVHYRAEQGGTSHFSVIDRFGNAVACTQSVNTRFGSKVLVPKAGIVLNNEIDDFALRSGGNLFGLIGNEANALQPKKRPLSSMSPTIILRGDRVQMVVGASGGPRIISATLQTILNVLDFRMPVKESVEAPRIHHQWIPDQLVTEPNLPAEIKISLERRGHVVRERGNIGIVQAIVSQRGKVTGAADSRKEERARSQ